MTETKSEIRDVRLIAKLAKDPLWFDGLPDTTRRMVITTLLNSLTRDDPKPSTREIVSVTRALALLERNDIERAKLEQAAATAELMGTAPPMPAVAMQVNGDISVAMPDLSGMTEGQLRAMLGDDEDGSNGKGRNGDGDD